MIRPFMQVERAHKECPSKKAGNLIASPLHIRSYSSGAVASFEI